MFETKQGYCCLLPAEGQRHSVFSNIWMIDLDLMLSSRFCSASDYIAL
jgi:hypothetical protein